MNRIQIRDDGKEQLDNNCQAIIIYSWRSLLLVVFTAFRKSFLLAVTHEGIWWDVRVSVSPFPSVLSVTCLLLRFQSIQTRLYSWGRRRWWGKESVSNSRFSFFSPFLVVKLLENWKIRRTLCRQSPSTYFQLKGMIESIWDGWWLLLLSTGSGR